MRKDVLYLKLAKPLLKLDNYLMNKHVKALRKNQEKENQCPIPPFPHLPPCACSEKCPAAVRGTLFHRNRTSAFLTIPIEANVHALASVTAASIAAG